LADPPSTPPGAFAMIVFMTTMLRRFLVLAVLLFWQGGFVFYSAVVVPVGQETLTSGTTQGFITRQVTVYLNVAGGVALVPLLWDALAGDENSRLRKQLRLFAWCGLAATLAVLVWMHPRLDEFLDADLHIIHDLKSFRPWHRWYLWTSTLQWALGVLYMALMLVAWRDEDRKNAAAKRE
jgi:hypothetical protein